MDEYLADSIMDPRFALTGMKEYVEEAFRQICSRNGFGNWASRSIDEMGNIRVVRFDNDSLSGGLLAEEFKIDRTVLFREAMDRKAEDEKKGFRAAPQTRPVISAPETKLTNLRWTKRTYLTDREEEVVDYLTFWDEISTETMFIMDQDGGIVAETPDSSTGRRRRLTYSAGEVRDAVDAVSKGQLKPPRRAPKGSSTPNGPAVPTPRHVVLDKDGKVVSNVGIRPTNTTPPSSGVSSAPDPKLSGLMAEIRKHKRSYDEEGDGITAPRSARLTCTECGTDIWGYMQGYGDDEPTDPEDAWEEHVAKITATYLRVRLDYEGKPEVGQFVMGGFDFGVDLETQAERDQRLLLQYRGLSVPSRAYSKTFAISGAQPGEAWKALMDVMTPAFEATKVFDQIAKAMGVEREPEDPREKALWAKRHKSKGPEQENFTKRGKK